MTVKSHEDKLFIRGPEIHLGASRPQPLFASGFMLAQRGLCGVTILNLSESFAVDFALLRYRSSGGDETGLILLSGALVFIRILTADDNDVTAPYEGQQSICGVSSLCA